MKKGIVIAGILLLALVGWRFRELSAEVSIPGIQELQLREGVPVRVARPELRDLAEEVELRGQLVASMIVPASFEVDGRLEEISVDVGDLVRRGQVLARLDERSARADLAVARAALAGAEATLAKAMKGPRAQELEQARAGRDEARAAAAFAGEELERLRSLVAQRAASRQQLDGAVNGHKAAVARLSQAEQRLSLLKEGTRSEDLAAARAQRDLAAARLDLAEIRLSKHRLEAPLDGVVTRREVDPGCFIKNMANPKTIVELARVDPLHFVAPVSELYVPHLSRSASVELLFDALPGERFEARLQVLDPIGDSVSRSFRAEFTLPNPDGRLRPAMFGRTRVTLRARPGALTVPSAILRDPAGVLMARGAEDSQRPRVDALHGPGRRAVVMVGLDGGMAAGRAVRVGIVDEGRAEILEGLDARAVLIIEGFEELQVGQKLALIEGRKEGGEDHGNR